MLWLALPCHVFLCEAYSNVSNINLKLTSEIVIPKKFRVNLKKLFNTIFFFISFYAKNLKNTLRTSEDNY